MEGTTSVTWFCNCLRRALLVFSRVIVPRCAAPPIGDVGLQLDVRARTELDLSTEDPVVYLGIKTCHECPRPVI